MPMSVEELYEAYMDEETPFGEDVYGFFVGEEPPKDIVEALQRPLGGAGVWAEEWGGYLPKFDPAKIGFAEREKELAFKEAADVLDLTNRATDLAYETESAAISAGLEKDIRGGREMVGRLGLRSGDVETAIQDTMTTAGNKVKSLGDRFKIQKDETKDKYDARRADAVLDYDKSVYDSKEEWYQDVLRMVDKLTDVGAFDPSVYEFEATAKEVLQPYTPAGLACLAYATAGCNIQCWQGLKGVSKSCVNRCKDEVCGEHRPTALIP